MPRVRWWTPTVTRQFLSDLGAASGQHASAELAPLGKIRPTADGYKAGMVMTGLTLTGTIVVVTGLTSQASILCVALVAAMVIAGLLSIGRCKCGR